MVADWIFGVIASSEFWAVVCTAAVIFAALLVHGWRISRNPTNTATHQILGQAYAVEQEREAIERAEREREVEATISAYRRGYEQAAREARRQA